MIFGRVVCLFKGHRRGVEFHKGIVYVHFRCPRCGRETRYKTKPAPIRPPLKVFDDNQGSAGDDS